MSVGVFSSHHYQQYEVLVSRRTIRNYLNVRKRSWDGTIEGRFSDLKDPPAQDCGTIAEECGNNLTQPKGRELNQTGEYCQDIPGNRLSVENFGFLDKTIISWLKTSQVKKPSNSLIGCADEFICTLRALANHTQKTYIDVDAFRAWLSKNRDIKSWGYMIAKGNEIGQKLLGEYEEFMR